MSGRKTTLVTAKQASTKPTSSGVPPSEVMNSGKVGCSSGDRLTEKLRAAEQAKCEVQRGRTFRY